MYLSKLDILGFKSFAHKTKLEFNGGLTCVIGPNGSGKSNIVDAIRWVLGEQRVSSLRSDKMENVIFNGTKTRKPVGMTEVSMTIQNNKKILDTEFEEVVISRRLYRSGESQYLINKTPVRLKDILDLFMDTGMGANSYSVIELKMVESILSENKYERRQLFEEAAGVVKYKVRRKSALKKLEATRIDLTRIDDIIIEVEKTVSSLSRQVAKARRYLSLNDELKKCEVDLSRLRYHRLLESIRPLEVQLKEASKLKEESSHQITMDEALLEDYKSEQIKTEQGLQKINSSIHELDAEIARINQAEAVAKTKAEENIKTRERYKVDIEDYEKKIILLEENVLQYQTELDHLTSQKEIIDQNYSAVESERLQEIEKLQKEKAEIDKLNSEFRQQLQSLSNMKEVLKQKEYQLGFLDEQAATIDENIASRSAGLKTRETELDISRKNRQNSENNLEKLNNNLKDLTAKSDQLQEKIKTAETERQTLLVETEKVRSRQSFFQHIIANYEGHSKSTQFVMTQKDQIKGIHGPLAELISVDENYAQLVELILGEALNYILVDDIDSAKKMIQLVRESDKGRITCIPLNRTRFIEIPEIPDGLNSLTLLSDLIVTDEKYRHLIKILLGDVAVVDNFEEALILSEKHPNLRLATSSGEMVNFNREISGGSVSKKQSTIIGRHDQLKKYTRQLQEFEKELPKVEKLMNGIRDDLQKNTANQGKIKDEIAKTQREITELEKKEHQITYEIDKNKKESELDNNHLIIIRKNIKELNQNQQTIEVEVEDQQKKLNELEKETISRTNSYERKSDELQILIEEVQKVRLDTTNIQNQIYNRQNDLNRSSKTIVELKSDIEKKGSEIEQIGKMLVQITEESEQRRNEQIIIWEKRDQLDKEQEDVARGFQEVKEKIMDIESQIKKYRKQHDFSLEHTRTFEMKINENRYKAENIREYILKEYSEDIEIGLPFEGLNENETEEQIESIHNRIKNLGPVNPLAVGEYDKEKERLDFLTKQRDDLNKAENSLVETIDKINTTARKQFLETFAAIKVNFETVFHSFFENGEGSINLTDNQDPLEADIEISVRTKGNRLQTLSLLSGGEKTLTAISLLFAIYLVKPSPFCILDEVDAPLDDVNILRFTEALKSFSDNTQFIVVTHNKRTMEAAQSMYGVTMEEEGVSKLVSVKFN